MSDDARRQSIAREMVDEVKRATEKYGPFNSAHEGFAVLMEEVDELWDEVKVKQTLRDPARLRAEAIQIGAMAIRFVEDIVIEQGGKR